MRQVNWIRTKEKLKALVSREAQSDTSSVGSGCASVLSSYSNNNNSNNSFSSSSSSLSSSSSSVCPSSPSASASASKNRHARSHTPPNRQSLLLRHHSHPHKLSAKAQQQPKLHSPPNHLLSELDLVDFASASSPLLLPLPVPNVAPPTLDEGLHAVEYQNGLSLLTLFLRSLMHSRATTPRRNTGSSSVSSNSNVSSVASNSNADHWHPQHALRIPFVQLRRGSSASAEGTLSPLLSRLLTHRTAPHHTTLHHTTPHHTTPHHTTPHYTTPHYTAQHHTTAHHTALHHTTVHHTTPHHTTPHHSTPQHTIPHHTTPQYTTPHYTTPHHHSTPYHTTHHSTPHHITPFCLFSHIRTCVLVS